MEFLLLESLKEDGFDLSIGFIHTPAAARRALQKSVAVRRIALALRYGAITENMLREFVSSIVGGFSQGRRLQHDLALAAIAVVLERRPTDFAEEYLHDLARLKLTEMSTSIFVARQCLKGRYSMPKHQAVSFAFPSKNRPIHRALTAAPRRWSDGLRPRSAIRYPKCAGAA